MAGKAQQRQRALEWGAASTFSAGCISSEQVHGARSKAAPTFIPRLHAVSV